MLGNDLSLVQYDKLPDSNGGTVWTVNRRRNIWESGQQEEDLLYVATGRG